MFSCLIHHSGRTTFRSIEVYSVVILVLKRKKSQKIVSKSTIYQSL